LFAYKEQKYFSLSRKDGGGKGERCPGRREEGRESGNSRQLLKAIPDQFQSKRKSGVCVLPLSMYRMLVCHRLPPSAFYVFSIHS